MDPQAAWNELLSAYTEGDFDQVEELARGLLNWLDRDGFPPTIADRAGPELNGVLARAGCQFALDAVRSRWSCVEGTA